MTRLNLILAMSTVVIKDCLHISFHDIKINDYNDYHKKYSNLA